MEFLKKFFKIKKKEDKYTDFYKVAEERQQVLDSFIDHSLCSYYSKCKTFKLFSKALPANDIAYIYTRTLSLLKILKKNKIILAG